MRRIRPIDTTLLLGARPSPPRAGRARSVALRPPRARSFSGADERLSPTFVVSSSLTVQTRKSTHTPPSRIEYFPESDAALRARLLGLEAGQWEAKPQRRVSFLSTEPSTRGDRNAEYPLAIPLRTRVR